MTALPRRRMTTKTKERRHRTQHMIKNQLNVHQSQCIALPPLFNNTARRQSATISLGRNSQRPFHGEAAPLRRERGIFLCFVYTALSLPPSRLSHRWKWERHSSLCSCVTTVFWVPFHTHTNYRRRNINSYDLLILRHYYYLKKKDNVNE